MLRDLLFQLTDLVLHFLPLRIAAPLKTLELGRGRGRLGSDRALLPAGPALPTASFDPYALTRLGEIKGGKRSGTMPKSDTTQPKRRSRLLRKKRFEL